MNNGKSTYLSLANLRARIAFEKYRFFLPQTISDYRRLLTHEKMSADELREFNFERRKEILFYAYENSIYYRRRFNDLGFSPNDVQKEEDWNLVPILTKQNVRDYFDEIQASSIPRSRVFIRTTGGSTGVPLKTLGDRSSSHHALGWRARKWWGVPILCDYVACGRSPEKTSFLGRLKKWPIYVCVLNASCMTEESCSAFVQKVREIKPLMFYGYAGGISQFAQFCLDNKIEFNNFSAIVTTSSPISFVQKEFIEKALNAPVYDQYGCVEINWLALQCQRRGGLHINSDERHIEFLSENNQTQVPVGALGNITVTDFGNRVFPLIRYQMGDMGKAMAGQCECGLPFPLMESVRGRVSDSLFFPNGTVIAGEYATTLFDAFPEAVKAFQVYQKADYSVELRIVPNLNHVNSQNQIEQVRQKFQQLIGSTPLTVVSVSEIPHDRGKTRFVISEVNSSTVRNCPTS
ncbi:MAG: hypothetical protein PHO46_04615 [Thermoguttaceae bacterium]|jgi:phenylacetate-CoA ligase|nr:hypothetical protein [Thermoguttaceae bacterium]